MNKIYIVHRWEGTKDSDWYPWLAKKCKNADNEVYLFNMPNTESPVIDEWVRKLEEEIHTVDENTYFVGHSIGCQTIIRYLEKTNPKIIGGCLLVAPWLDLLPEAISDKESYDTAYPWIHTKIDFAKLKKFGAKITCIFSDNDYFVSPKEAERFENLLSAKTIFAGNLGHISEEDGILELENIYEELKNLQNL